MNWIDRASTVSGWAFLLAAAVVVGRPGGPVARALGKWGEARQTRRIVHDRWDELISGRGVVGAVRPSAVVVEFIDYQCAYCRMLHDTVSVVLRARKTDGVVVRQLPRLGDPVSRGAALSALCADAQGRFSAMHRYLLTADEWVKDRGWQEVAEKVGVENVQQFESCIRSDDASRMISQDSSWARRLAIKGTPALVDRRGVVHTGIADRSSLEKWLGRARPGRDRQIESDTPGR